MQAALFADRLIAATPRRIGQVQAARLVQEARLYFDPDRAIADEEEALAKRGVWLRHGSAPSTTDITMTLDSPDALLFDQTVARIAGDLRGSLATPRTSRSGEHAQLGSSLTPKKPWTCSPAASQPPATVAVRRSSNVHLTPADLEYKCSSARNLATTTDLL